MEKKIVLYQGKIIHKPTWHTWKCKQNKRWVAVVRTMHTYCQLKSMKWCH